MSQNVEWHHQFSCFSTSFLFFGWSGRVEDRLFANMVQGTLLSKSRTTKMASSNTKYGLIFPKKATKGAVTKPASANVFGDDSDEDGGMAAVNQTVNKEAARAKVRKQTQLEIDKALQEDPSVYEYDNIYDDIQAKKVSSSVKEANKKDKKPKYISGLLKMAEVRKREEERRIERKVQKEREEEGNQFADKEAFVTAAYKKKMLEQQALEEKERREAAMEEMLDVTKQKDLSGFYRYLYRETTGKGSPEAQDKGETEEGVKTEVKKEPTSDASSSDSDDSASDRDTKPRSDRDSRHTSEKEKDREDRNVDRSRHLKSKSHQERSRLDGTARRRSRSRERERKHRDRRSRSRSPAHRRSDKDRHHSRSRDRKRKRSSSRDRVRKRSRSGERSRGAGSSTRKETKDKRKNSKDARSASRERKEPSSKPQPSPSPVREASPVMLPARPPDEDLDRDDPASDSESSAEEAQGGQKEDKDRAATTGQTAETAEKGGRGKEEPVKYAKKTTEDAVLDARKRFLARKLARERARPVVEQE